ncbi:MAG: 50S ribosomal protein L24 [Cellvibrionales bacterium]|jgi:large subunit ribosomal protein L24|nr:50S ribosomal protein L24 [Cellvibrionales bacterium]MDG2472126.1 50S ribosomal protein L24 [Pseudomonadales bacterium]HCH20596.1 50S ribosomal protein L24 [Cellvibrionales bacterium]|tara:strand:+ start:343 stop:654 length:312 start_codon:yes stop_codon:yes gene_type:complete
MKKIKSEDEVIVLAGKDKGKRGKVTKILDDGRVLVSGVNMIKKHTKPNPQAGIAGGIVEKEAPLQGSNIAIYNAATSKADRVGFRVEDGKKVRFFKSNNELIN